MLFHFHSPLLFSLPTQRCFTALRTYGNYSNAFLCLRRGVSEAENVPAVLKVFSLPTQRCFVPGYFHQADTALFSAYAEVFPAIANAQKAVDAFLCLRRGVSLGQITWS